MPDNKFSEEIFENLQPKAKESDFAENSDLDKINASHSKHMAILSNWYEFWTHRTVLLIVFIVLFVLYIVTRYLLVCFPNFKLLSVVNKDSAFALSYFGTAVASWFVTKNLEK